MFMLSGLPCGAGNSHDGADVSQVDGDHARDGDAGSALMGIGSARGDNRALNAAEQAINSRCCGADCWTGAASSRLSKREPGRCCCCC